nr:G protein-coupled receptor [Proales similis]
MFAIGVLHMLSLIQLTGAYPSTVMEISCDANLSFSAVIYLEPPAAINFSMLEIQLMNGSCYPEPSSYIVVGTSDPLIAASWLDFYTIFQTLNASFPNRLGFNSTHISIFLYGFKGFDLHNPIDLNEFERPTVIVRFSKLDLFANQTLFEGCKSLLSKQGTFASAQLNSLVFELGNRYSRSVCPLMFNNTSVGELRLTEISNSMVMHNELTFAEIDANRTNFYFDISDLVLSVYNVDLSPALLNKPLFAGINYLLIEGILNRIQTDDTLWAARQLRVVFLALHNIRKFIEHNPTFINRELLNYPGLLEIRLLFFYPSVFANHNMNRYIPFHDQDFCLYARYPMNDPELSVYFTSENFSSAAYSLNCSCTIIWLVWHGPVYEEIDLDIDKYGIGVCAQWSFLQLAFDRCNFTRMLENCRPTTAVATDPNDHSWRESAYFLAYMRYQMGVVMQPAVVIVALILNVLVVLGLRNMMRTQKKNNNLKKLNNKLFLYMIYSSGLNIAMSVLHALHPLTECISYNGLYCSPYILSNITLGFYLFGENLIGTWLKTASNSCILAFSLHRYALNTGKFSAYRRLNPRRVLACLLIVAFLLSINRLFRNDKFSLFGWSNIRGFNYFIWSSKAYIDETWLVIGPYYLQLVYNDLFCMGASVYVDLRLLGFLRAKMRKSTTASTAATANSANKKENTEKKIARMVLLNSVFSCLFRFPEMCANIVGILHSNHFLPNFTWCELDYIHQLSGCLSLNVLAQSIYVFSFFENFILLFFFNEKFVQELKNLFKR